MKILVCMKQVPDTAEIQIDPETNTLIRTGVPAIVNPFDSYALEFAVRLKEAHGGSVTVLSMGPEQAKAALRECLAHGAEQAVLVTDRVFGGSDTLATSYVLSNAIRHLEAEGGKFDLVLCGQQAIDGDTGQVGPELAEHLGYAQVTYASDITIAEGKLRAKRETGEGYDVIEATLPAVVTVTKTKTLPRYATIRSRIEANEAELQVISTADFAIDTTMCGLAGSPTQVKKTFTPERGKAGIKIVKPAPQAADELIELLAASQIL